MKLLIEAWALLRIANAVESNGLRDELVRAHLALIVAAYFKLAVRRRPSLGELLVASGAVT